MYRHTPGPWRVSDLHRPKIEIVSPSTLQTVLVATIEDSTNPRPVGEAVANARLIAAAPEMESTLIEALDWLVEYIRWGQEGRKGIPPAPYRIESKIRDVLSQR